LQVYPTDSFGNPCVALPTVNFSSNSSQAAVAIEGERVEVTYIPSAYGSLLMAVNFIIPGCNIFSYGKPNVRHLLKSQAPCIGGISK
jgi:hypothetical protein